MSEKKTRRIEYDFIAAPSDVYDKLLGMHLSGQELAAAFFVIRKTYGFGKTEDFISASQFIKAMRLKWNGSYKNQVRNISHLLRGLRMRRIMNIHKDPRGRRKAPNVISINMDIHTWMSPEEWQDKHRPRRGKNRKDTVCLHRKDGGISTPYKEPGAYGVPTPPQKKCVEPPEKAAPTPMSLTSTKEANSKETSTSKGRPYLTRIGINTEINEWLLAEKSITASSDGTLNGAVAATAGQPLNAVGMSPLPDQNHASSDKDVPHPPVPRPPLPRKPSTEPLAEAPLTLEAVQKHRQFWNVNALIDRFRQLTGRSYQPGLKEIKELCTLADQKGIAQLEWTLEVATKVIDSGHLAYNEAWGSLLGRVHSRRRDATLFWQEKYSEIIGEKITPPLEPEE